MGVAVLGGDENRGMMRRIGFEGRTRVDRHDFGISWQDELPGGGRVVSDEIEVVLDIEAFHESEPLRSRPLPKPF